MDELKKSVRSVVVFFRRIKEKDFMAVVRSAVIDDSEIWSMD